VGEGFAEPTTPQPAFCAMVGSAKPSPTLKYTITGGSVRRLNQIVLILSTVLGSWLGMQAIHESGHVFGAWLTGGRVTRVVLHPLTISRTDLAHNPSPLAVVWAGPVFFLES
jgi:Peptidase M50B-like